MKKTVIGKVIETSYKSTSYVGNPSYYVTFQDESGKIYEGYTAENAACGYSCTNSYFKEGAKITYHTSGSNIVIDFIHPIK